MQAGSDNSDSDLTVDPTSSDLRVAPQLLKV